ncbi:unnamed protein product [Caenorhabditis bovis]|uniref:Uncharacterized protein n=1 Tax=Caenorhabditis bovis TaxID=2654633 RepID=A0A8S1E8K6_9PELO|nr:unnamed protein product [Caenorhabditis bovis]
MICKIASFPQRRSHIWDQLFDFQSNRHHSTTRRIPPRIVCDSTGSTVDVSNCRRSIEVETTITETIDINRGNSPPPKPPMVRSIYTIANRERDPYPERERSTVASLAERSFVTNTDRENADPPDHLGFWSWEKPAENQYDRRKAEIAFAEYAKRQKEKMRERKKHQEEMIRVSNRRQKSLNQRKSKNCPRKEDGRKLIKCDKMPKNDSVEIRNKRNDEVKIDRINYTNDKLNDFCDAAKPAFYGTIEAERAAARAAEHISNACVSLKKLNFVADRVYPESQQHLEKLTKISDELKDFNAQLKLNKAKVPKNMNQKGNNVAHFVIDS